MSVIIQLLSEEANCVKTRNVDKEQPPVKGKRAAQMGDEALIVTNSHKGGNPRHRKGKCNHCGKEGHWVCKCHTKKREEEVAAATTAAAANPNGQAAQANSGTKPENRPVGSANAIYPNDSDEDGFWAVEEEVAHVYPNHAEPDPLMGEPEPDTDDEEAFRARSWGAEDDNTLDWVGFDDWLVEKGEERDVENKAKAVTMMLVEDTPHIESQPIHYHALAPSHTLVSRGPLNEEEVSLQNVSPRGEHIANMLGQTQMLLEQVQAMRHTIWLPTPPPRDCNIWAHNPDGPKLHTHMHEGQRLSSGIDVQVHPPSEPDVQAASAAQLEGEELWGTAMTVTSVLCTLCAKLR